VLPRSGFRFNPQLDYDLAAHWWGYKLEEFWELLPDEQAYRVAVYRIERQMEAVLAWQKAKRRKPGS